MGLHRALPEAEIVGVDIRPQPRYPFTFIRTDAMLFPLVGYDFIWASPPCQGYSEATPLRYREILPKLIEPIRERLLLTGSPFVIENVENARHHLIAPVLLCGTMFDLKIWRHRYFETSFSVRGNLRCYHKERPITLHCGSHTRSTRKCTPVKEVRIAMDIDWMTGKELNEAIPPVYSEYIARQWIRS